VGQFSGPWSVVSNLGNRRGGVVLLSTGH